MKLVFFWQSEMIHRRPFDEIPSIVSMLHGRTVVPGGARGAMAPPDFGRSVDPISTRRGRLCPPHYY